MCGHDETFSMIVPGIRWQVDASFRGGNNTPREHDVRSGLKLFMDFETTRRPFLSYPASSTCSAETLRYGKFQSARAY